MKKNILVGLVAGMVSYGAYAGNAAPLGLELGVATYAQVKQQIGSKTSLSDGGINAYSDGKMLKSDGDGLGIDGLSDITFIFDQSDRLAGVLMTLPKQNGMSDLNNTRFRQTMNALGKKYRLVKKDVPFVGDSYAEFREGDSLVELDAPHMSFTMSLTYETRALHDAFTRKSAEERQQHEQQQDSAF